MNWNHILIEFLTQFNLHANIGHFWKNVLKLKFKVFLEFLNQLPVEEKNLLNEGYIAQYLLLILIVNSEQMQRINHIDYRADILHFPIVLRNKIVELNFKIFL